MKENRRIKRNELKTIYIDTYTHTYIGTYIQDMHTITCEYTYTSTHTHKHIHIEV